MATVYHAWDSLGQIVALKVMSTGFSQDPSFVERFDREGALRLRHPNIVHIFDAGTAAGRHFIAMQYVDGESLAQRLHRRRPLPLPEAVSITTQMASALDYAHQLGVIHRDIKPDNVIIGKDGRAWLADFGIARVVGLTQMTRTGLFVGTPMYMAPEQVQGQGVIDRRTDIYGLGVVLYEMLAGRPPFTAEEPWAIISAILNEQPARPRILNPGIPLVVERAILKAIRKAPHQRYQTAGRLARALRGASLPDSATPERHSPPARPSAAGAVDGRAHRQRTRWVPPTLVGSVLIAAIVGMIMASRTPLPIPYRAAPTAAATVTDTRSPLAPEDAAEGAGGSDEGGPPAVSPGPTVRPAPSATSHALPPTATPVVALEVLGPEDGARYNGGDMIHFDWTGPDLTGEPGRRYEVRVVCDSPPTGACYGGPDSGSLGWLGEPKLYWKVDIPTGHYRWQVALMTVAFQPSPHFVRDLLASKWRRFSVGSAAPVPVPTPTPMK